jgi:hypothetical protein
MLSSSACCTSSAPRSIASSKTCSKGLPLHVMTINPLLSNLNCTRENEPPLFDIKALIVAQVRSLLSVLASLVNLGQHDRENEESYMIMAIPPDNITPYVMESRPLPTVRGSPLAIARFTKSLVQLAIDVNQFSDTTASAYPPLR